MSGIIGHCALLMSYGNSGGGTSYQTETTYWANGIAAAGGTVIAADKDLVDACIVQMKTRSYYSKLVAWWPMVGPTIVCHRVPAIDVDVKGIATTSGFTDSDVDNTTGIFVWLVDVDAAVVLRPGVFRIVAHC